MALDSAASLLFKIGADTSDAQGNIQRFRSVLSKDLAGLKAEFDDWGKKIFGNLDSTKAIMLGVTAALGAAAVAVGAALHAAAEKAAEFADEIEDGMDKTGLSAEQMSKLRFAAERAGVQYGALVNGLVKFERSIVDAASGTKKQLEAFQRLGISQKELEAGTADLMPILMRTADAFKAQSSTVEKAAISQNLFSRSGADLLEFLSLGSTGIQQFMERAGELGRVLDENAIKQAKSFKIARQELAAMNEALALSVGKAFLPLETGWATWKIGMLEFAKKAESYGGPLSPTYWLGLAVEVAKARGQIELAVQAALAEGGGSRLGPAPDDGERVKEVKQDYEGLSSILEQVWARLASLAGEEARVAFESTRMQIEISKATALLAELSKEGKITGGVLEREMTALADLPAAIAQLTSAQMDEMAKAHRDAVINATVELQGRLAGLQERTFGNREAGFGREIALLREKLATERTLTEENLALLAAIERDGLRRIAAERAAAFAQTLQSLQQEMAAIVTARMTITERLRYQYDDDQQRFSAVEEDKALTVARTEAEADAIRQQFALNRRVSLEAYMGDLNALRNSTGWRGVFGEEFAAAIRGNEALTRLWAESANQSLLMVRVALVSTELVMQRAFGTFARAMAANISQALVYKTSIGEATRAAAASVLQSIAAQSLVQAIYAFALGWLRIAERDFGSATAAFKAAAMFGAVGAAAAVAGRAVAPQREGASASGGSSGGASGGGAAGGSGGSGGARLQIIINGHIIGQTGIEELTDMINEAVQGRDVRLVATQVKQGTRALQ